MDARIGVRWPRIRRPILGAIALAAAASCGREAGGSAAAPPESRAPAASTIVLVTVDAVPPARLKLYGGATATPALDKLVAAGGVAMEGWTAVPMTRPAVASMFTGLGADRHGVLDDIYTTLGEKPPVLAESLKGAGYKTAAFPGSPFLESASGVLRGFQVVDEPDLIPFGTAQRIVRPLAADQVVAHALGWLKSIAPRDRAFVWLHFGETSTAVPGLFGAPKDGSGLDLRIDAVDKGLDQLLTGLQSLSRLEGAEIVWAGTYGDVSEAGSGIPGPGFSPSDNAIRVPVVYRAIPGRRTGASKGTVWGPDLAVTLASAGGTTLAGAEGVDLATGVPEDRTIFAWSTAPLEQMGWKPWTCGLRGKLRVCVGLMEGTSSPEAASLRAAVDRRSSVPRATVPLQAVAAILEKHGIKADPLPDAGRDCGPVDRCASIARELWEARWTTSANSAPAAIPHFKAVREQDPQNLAAMVEWGINNSSETIHPRGKALFEQAVRQYPGAPLALHWFGHTFDRQEPKEAERLWAAVVAARPGEYDLLYDMACMRAKTGDVAASIDVLRKAFHAGYRRWDALQVDPDLRAVRADPAFASLMREFGR